MKYSVVGLKLTESFEGCRLTAYPDSVGIPTIGYGHTQGVSLGMTCTQTQAEQWLLEDITLAENFVNKILPTGLTQGQFNALVDFTFNLGVGSLQHSTLYQLIKAKDFVAPAKEFPRWDKAGGKEVAGLLRRRLAEQAEFTQPAST